MGLDKDDVFVQGLMSAECVKLLFNCLQNLETEMGNVKEISLAAKQQQIKGIQQLQINSTITFINEKFAKFEKQIKHNNQKTKNVKKENSYLTRRFEEMGAVLDRKEQYSRSNCLLINGFNEIEGEGIDEQKRNRRAYESND